jgi:dihydrofolate synthase/folylpolyglutamate synthase
MINYFISTGGRSDWEPEHYTIPLLGLHQVENAATAYATLELAREAGMGISRSAITKGFANVKWPGRFEIVEREPLVIVDSAHNQDSALRLRLAMDDYLNGKPIILLFGASEDKDVGGMFTYLLPRVQMVVATKSEHPRAMDPNILVELAHQYGKKAVLTTTIEEGLSEALRLAGKDKVVMIAGSIFIAAAAREILLNKKTDTEVTTE